MVMALLCARDRVRDPRCLIALEGIVCNGLVAADHPSVHWVRVQPSRSAARQHIAGCSPDMMILTIIIGSVAEEASNIAAGATS